MFLYVTLIWGGWIWLTGSGRTRLGGLFWLCPAHSSYKWVHSEFPNIRAVQLSSRHFCLYTYSVVALVASPNSVATDHSIFFFSRPNLPSSFNNQDWICALFASLQIVCRSTLLFSLSEPTSTDIASDTHCFTIARLYSVKLSNSFSKQTLTHLVTQLTFALGETPPHFLLSSLLEFTVSLSAISHCASHLSCPSPPPYHSLLNFQNAPLLASSLSSHQHFVSSPLSPLTADPAAPLSLHHLY